MVGNSAHVMVRTWAGRDAGSCFSIIGRGRDVDIGIRLSAPSVRILEWPYKRTAPRKQTQNFQRTLKYLIKKYYV